MRTATRRDREPVPVRRLRAPLARVHGVSTGDDVVVDPVLRELGERSTAVQPRHVGLVVAEEGLWPSAVRTRSRLEAVPGQQRMVDHHRVLVQRQARRVGPLLPAPRVAEPQGGQDVQGCLVRSVVRGLDRHVDVCGRGLGVGDVNRPVAPVVEDAGVHQLELEVPQPAACVLLDQTLVGELRLGVVVAPLEQGMAGQTLQVPPVLLGVLAVVALRSGQAEHPFLEDRVAAVPQRNREAQLMADVGDPGHPVLVPAVGPRPGVVVREGGPRVPVCAVVLANGAPSALGEVGPPFVPGVRVEQVVLGPARRLGQAAMLAGELGGAPGVGAGHDVSPLGPGVSSAALGPSLGATSTLNRCHPQPGSSTYIPSFRSSPVLS